MDECKPLKLDAVDVGGGAYLVEFTAGDDITLVHFSAQRKHFLWDTLGTIRSYIGHNS